MRQRDRLKADTPLEVVERITYRTFLIYDFCPLQLKYKLFLFAYSTFSGLVWKKESLTITIPRAVYSSPSLLYIFLLLPPLLPPFLPPPLLPPPSSSPSIPSFRNPIWSDWRRKWVSRIFCRNPSLRTKSRKTFAKWSKKTFTSAPNCQKRTAFSGSFSY